MSETLTIINIDEAPTKTGKKRWLAETFEGEIFSVWNQDVAFTMQGYVLPYIFECKTSHKDNYHNILDAVPSQGVGNGNAPKAVSPRLAIPDKRMEAAQKNASVAYSYAKDLVVAGKVDMVEMGKRAIQIAEEIELIAKKLSEVSKQ